MDLKDITNKDELKKRTSNLFNDFDKMLQSMADDDISYKKQHLYIIGCVTIGII